MRIISLWEKESRKNSRQCVAWNLLPFYREKKKKMSEPHCEFCYNESISLMKDVKTSKKRKLSKLIELFGGTQTTESMKLSPSICKDCFYEAKSVHNFYEKCQNPEVKKRLLKFSEETTESRSRNVSTQTEPQRFILIMNQIPDEIFFESFSESSLKSTFCEYGIISNVYLTGSRWKKDYFAQITFIDEQASCSLWEDIQKKIKEVYGDQVAATLIPENDSPIDILTDDCLEQIFSYIEDIHCQVTIQEVCQRWQKVVPLIWAKLKLFDVHYDKISIDKLEEIVIQSKKSLKEIQIYVSKNAERQFKAVEDNCDNLENLAILEYWGSPEKFVEYLESLFTAKQQLKKLAIRTIHRSCNFGFLNNLPESMVEIHLFAENEDFTHTNSQMDFSKFRNLRFLYLRLFDFGYEDSLSGLENLVNLEYFILLDSTVHSRTFEKLLNLTKLKELTIPSQTVDDDILSIIIRNNKGLEILDISNNRNVLNNTFRMIGELTNLNRLYMKNLRDLDQPPLSKLDKLKSLNCQGCSTITDWDLMILIDRAPALENIDVSHCNVSNRLLVSAEVSIRTRQNMKEKFIIHVMDEKMITYWSKMPNKSHKMSVRKSANKPYNHDYHTYWYTWTIL